MNQLWIEVADGNGAGWLSAALEAGKENNLPVHAVVRLLRTSTQPSQTAERNILGETARAHAVRRPFLLPWAGMTNDLADWLRVDVPDVAQAMKKRLVALATTPGLAGMVLSDTAAPGYENKIDTPFALAFDTMIDFGYTPTQRLAFLRRGGFDPIDLITVKRRPGEANLSLPFYPDDLFQPGHIEVDERTEGDQKNSSPLQKWHTFRYQANVRFLHGLYTALRDAHPGLPLLVRNRDSLPPNSSGLYASWDRPEALPGRLRLQKGADPEAPWLVAPTSARRNVLQIGGGSSPLEYYARSVDAALKPLKKTGWDGFVLDLSEHSVSEVLERLAVLAPVPEP